MTLKQPKALTDQIQETALQLRRFNEIFEDDLTKFSPVINITPTPSGSTHYYVYWPKRTGRDPQLGLNLKNFHGFVTIEEIYLMISKREFERIGFTYRYINPYHEYHVSYNDGNTASDDVLHNYNFRFDKVPVSKQAKRVIEPQEHLQVLHQVPRFSFPAKHLSAETFLQTIKNTCYAPSGVAISASFHSSYR